MSEEQSEDSTSTATVDAIAVYLRRGTPRVCPVKAAHAHRLGALWMCPHGHRHAECDECIELGAGEAPKETDDNGHGGESKQGGSSAPSYVGMRLQATARSTHRRRSSLQLASEELTGDRAMVMAAVIQNGYSLQFASEELKGDKAVVMAAVTQNGYSLQFASEELKGDKAVVMAAVMQNGSSLQLASEELRGDTAIVTAADGGVAPSDMYTNPMSPLAEEQKRVPKSCPQGHALTPHTTEGDLGTCDGCSRSIAHHTRVMDCTACNYFLCDGCDPRAARRKLTCTDDTKTNDDAAGPGWVAGKERVLYITVTLDRGRQGDIHVHAGDAPYDALAVRFCELHALGPELVTNLTMHIETLVRKHGRQDGGSGGGEAAAAGESSAKASEGEGDGGETSTAGATDEAGEAEQGGETKGGGGGEEKGEPPEQKLRVGGGGDGEGTVVEIVLHTDKAQLGAKVSEVGGTVTKVTGRTGWQLWRSVRTAADDGELKRLTPELRVLARRTSQELDVLLAMGAAAAADKAVEAGVDEERTGVEGEGGEGGGEKEGGKGEGGKGEDDQQEKKPEQEQRQVQQPELRVGDRLVRVGSEQVPATVTSAEVAKMVKSGPFPLVLRFIRPVLYASQTVSDARRAEHMLDANAAYRNLNSSFRTRQPVYPAVKPFVKNSL